MLEVENRWEKMVKARLAQVHAADNWLCLLLMLHAACDYTIKNHTTTGKAANRSVKPEDKQGLAAAATEIIGNIAAFWENMRNFYPPGPLPARKK